MAERDLGAALQLLAERAQYITGASGAAIALREGDLMICRASAGPSAPELGATLQVNSGLSGESVRTRRTLRCDDAETDSRVNREGCRLLGISSVVVMPLVRDGEVGGVFELLSGRPYAFEERDLAALERLGEMIQTAIDHAEAARRAEKELTNRTLTSDEPSTPNVEKQTTANEFIAQKRPSVEINAALQPAELDPLDAAEVLHPTAALSDDPLAADSRVDDEPILLEMTLSQAGLAREGKQAADPAAGAKPVLELVEKVQETETRHPEAAPLNERGNIRSCEACGFPVSEGRTLCLDCESARAVPPAPEFLSQFASANQGWFRSHLYLVGTLLVAAATVALLVWFR
jgi:hypothetical protein